MQYDVSPIAEPANPSETVDLYFRQDLLGQSSTAQGRTMPLYVSYLRNNIQVMSLTDGVDRRPSPGSEQIIRHSIVSHILPTRLTSFPYIMPIRLCNLRVPSKTQ